METTQDHTPTTQLEAIGAMLAALGFERLNAPEVLSELDFTDAVDLWINADCDQFVVWDAEGNLGVETAHEDEPLDADELAAMTDAEAVAWIMNLL